jgi:hypothetical protein
MSWKDTNITNPGTSIKYGADDMEMVSRLFNGVTTGVAAVTIKSTNKWGFWDAILYFRNQADTKNITIRGPTNSPATDIDLTLPPSTANDTLASIGLAQTFAQKQTFTSGAVFTQMSSPSNPGSSKHHLFVASNGHLMKRDNSGVEVDYNLDVPVVPITMESGTLALRDFVRVMKVSSTYYAIKSDGTVISSGTNPATVIQAALDLSPPIEVIINTEGAGWDFQAGFTGLDCKSYNTIHLTGTSNLNVPSGYTGSMFKITGTRTNITIYSDGGYINEVATVSRNWVAVQIGVGDATDNIDNINIRGLVTFTSGDVVKINQGSTGTIESVLLDGLSTDDTRRFITWNVSDATKIKDVTVQNCRPLLDGGSVTDCFKDVKGTRTTFIANTLYGVQGSCNEMNVASGAVNTMVFGGNHTGVTGTFTDSGTDTYIDDATHTELKLKGTAITGSAISSDQNNYSPTGWNEKQNTLRVSASGAARIITGLVCGANPKNRIVRVLNVGTFDITLPNENTNSTAANRFKFASDYVLHANQSISLFYDTVDSRWRVLSDVSSGALLGVSNTFTEPVTIKKDASDLLFLYRPNSTTNINQDLDFDFNDSVGTQVTYCDLRATVLDGTDGSEDGRFQINIMLAGSKVMTHRFDNNGGLILRNNVSTNGTNTELYFDALDSGAASQSYGLIRSEIIDNTAGSEDGKLEFATVTAGSLTEKMILWEDGSLEVLAGQISVIRDANNTLLDLYRTDNSVGNQNSFTFYLQDSGSAKQFYSQISSEIVTATAGSEDGLLRFYNVRGGGNRNVLTLNQLGELELYNYTQTNFDEVGIRYYANDSGTSKQQYAGVTAELMDTTAASEDGQLDFDLVRAGTIQRVAKLANDGELSVGRDTSNQRSVETTLSDSSQVVTTNNTSSEVTVCSATVKGNTMLVDACVTLDVYGYILQNNATATTYTIRVKFGGTTAWEDSMGGSLSQSSTPRPWELHAIVHPRNQSSANVKLHGSFMMNDTSAPTTGQGSTSDDETASNANWRTLDIAKDITSDQTFSVTIQMSQASSTCEWAMDYFKYSHCFS